MSLTEYSETLELSSLTEPNRLNMSLQDLNFFNISMFFRDSVLLHLNDFGSIEPNSKNIEILKKFGSVQFGWIRKVLEFHCTRTQNPLIITHFL